MRWRSTRSAPRSIPQLWNEAPDDREASSPADPDKERFIKDEQLSQVWFAGVHSNVGGGYPDDSLAYIPFVWMITEAQAVRPEVQVGRSPTCRPVADR